jgi:hypothetical protein
VLTPEGQARIWNVFAGEEEDSLKGGTMVVSDGQDSASAVLDEFPFVNTNEQGETVLTVSATFASEVANFAWLAVEVVTAGGVVVDRTEGFRGKKASGSEWSISADLVLVARKEE